MGSVLWQTNKLRRLIMMVSQIAVHVQQLALKSQMVHKMKTVSCQCLLQIAEDQQTDVFLFYCCDYIK